MEKSGHREDFEEAMDNWQQSEGAADEEEARYRSTPPAKSKDAADRLIQSWRNIAVARRHVEQLYGSAADEAIRLNAELDRRIDRYGPASDEVAECLDAIQGRQSPSA